MMICNANGGHVVCGDLRCGVDVPQGHIVLHTGPQVLPTKFPKLTYACIV